MHVRGITCEKVPNRYYFRRQVMSVYVHASKRDSTGTIEDAQVMFCHMIEMMKEEHKRKDKAS